MAMNIFRVCGDMLHMSSKIILLLQLLRARNARGISVKTQVLYLLVFVTRYLDLFTMFYSYYNSVAKCFYITITFSTIYLIKYWDPIRRVYNKDQDSFPHWKCAVLPVFVLAFMTHLFGSGVDNFHLMELLWTFSIILESIAILPQLIVLRKYRLVENLTGKFILCLGLYRFFYILNWIYRSHNERNYRHHWVVYTCGVVQTLLYLDFFYQYWRSRCGCFNKQKIGDDSDDGANDEEQGDLIFELTKQEEHDHQKRQLVSSLSPETIKPLLVSEDHLLEDTSSTENTISDDLEDPSSSSSSSSSSECAIAIPQDHRGRMSESSRE